MEDTWNGAPSPLPKEAFRGHEWYMYLETFLRRGECELPNRFYDVVMAVLERLGHDSMALAGNSDDTTILRGEYKQPSWYPDDEAYAKLSIPERTLLDLGGPEFIKMTGSSDFISDGNTLWMKLAKNQSGANRLCITLRGDDLYDMRFFFYRRSKIKVDVENGGIKEIPEVIREVELYQGVFNSMLRTIFEETTGFDTHMPIVVPKPREGV